MPLISHPRHPSRITSTGPERFFQLGSLATWRPQRNTPTAFEAALQAHYCGLALTKLRNRVRARLGKSLS